jgi:cyanate permease
MSLVPLLAHQGGWDEALFVLAPVGLFAVLLWLANRRAAKRLDAEEEARPEHGGPTVG